jgi:hypothetical protein
MRAVLIAAVLAVLVVLGLAVRFGGAAAFTLALGFPSADAWLARLATTPVARHEVTVPIEGGRLAADLYRPAEPRGAVLLVHGLSRAGRRHPEMVRLARLLARHRRLVLAPEFEGLAAFRLSGREVDEVEAALRHLGRLGLPADVVGFSFGAGPALLAAARVPALRATGSFGGYADLRHVIGFVTTGVHRHRDRRYWTPQQEYNRWKLLSLLAGFAEDGPDRARLGTIAEQKLANPGVDTRPLAADLGEGGRRLLALAENRREEALPGLVARLPPGARRALEALSPLAAVPRLHGRLLLAHGRADDSIPFTESLHLADAAGPQARVVILRSFHHTGPRSLWDDLGARLRDGWGLVGLVDELLAP